MSRLSVEYAPGLVAEPAHHAPVPAVLPGTQQGAQGDPPVWWIDGWGF